MRMTRVAYVPAPRHWKNEMHKLMLEAVLSRASHLSVQSFDPNELGDKAALGRLVLQGFDVLIVPLTLPQFGSLRLAELVHQSVSPVHFVLCSDTSAPRDVLRTLFDKCIDTSDLLQFLLHLDSQATFPFPSERRLQHGKVEGAIAAILATASCFNKDWYSPSHTGEPSTLDEYRRFVQAVADDQADPDKAARGPGSQPQPVSAFISYSHLDADLRSTLEAHLSMLKRKQVIDTWTDRRITAGSAWKGDIDHALAESQVILLLVTANFLASDYCFDVEMKVAMARAISDEATVIPIIARECDWREAPFATLQAIPRSGSVLSAQDPDSAWTEVAREIRASVEALRERRPRRYRFNLKMLD